jgi:RecJ-like exonuclease
MYILTSDKCPECKGEGFLTHGKWAVFYSVDQTFNEQNGRHMNEAETLAWFQERAYSKLPPEEIECSRCKGTGKIEAWTDIQTFLIANEETISKFLKEHGK